MTTEDWNNLIFPPPGTIEDNLKTRETVYAFSSECYQNTRRAILIRHDIWLPKSQIKIVWGEFEGNYAKVRLSVPKWLVEKSLLDKYLKVD